MKIVINTAYGGIFPESAALRYDAKFIEDVESGRFVGHFSDKYGFAEVLKVIEIPDDASDHMIVNYDGSEGIIYCLNGVLHLIPEEEPIIRIVQ